MKQETLTEAAFNYAAQRFPNEKGKHCGTVAQEQYACRKGFIAGVTYQRNHVWKDPRKDKIEDGDYLTVIYEGGGKVTAEIATWKNGEYQGAYCMLVFAGKANIGKVAKISDLLPTSFDDILEANKDVLQRLKKGKTK